MSALRPISNPPNPWNGSEVEYLDEIPRAEFAVHLDHARTILSRHDPRFVGFEFGLNPYRGCQHACAYCEARVRHTYLGFGAGTDFDTQIVVKENAPELLREAFDAPSWSGETVVLSGATDCYQPLEATYRLTRRCLEVCAEYRNPVAIITKGALIERDLDVLEQLRATAKVTVSISIGLYDPAIARAIEPLVPSPQRRLATIRRLAAAGLDVGISVAPLILGLGDTDLVHLLIDAKSAGAARAVLSFLRVKPPVDAVFEERLRVQLPLRADRVLAMIERHDAYSQMVTGLYVSTCRRLGLPLSLPGDDRANTPSAGPVEERTFRRPSRPGDQLGLF